MDNNESLGNKSYRTNSDSIKSCDLKDPIKQCYFLDGKFFVIIDKSIAQKLNFDTKSEMFFQQKVAQDGSIIFRRFNLKGESESD